MKKFIITIAGFAAILLLMSAVIEVGLLYRPNIYAYKRQYVEDHLNEIRVLLLGSSHIEEAVKPELVGEGTFNMAISARLKEYDGALAEMFVPKMKHLEAVVMPVDYTFFFFGRDLAEPASGPAGGGADLIGTCRCMHTKYMGTRIDPIWYWSEILNSKLNFMSRFWNKREVLQECDSLGYVKLNVNERKSGWEYRARPLMFDPNAPINQATYQEMWQAYEGLAKTTQQSGVRLVLVSTPVYETYKERITKVMYNDMLQFVEKLKQKYPNVEYYNFIYAEGFLPEDFQDSSHLTDTGAVKFSKMLSKVLYPQK